MKLGAIDLNLLVPLQALLEEQSVTKAAERTHVGQPSMSASLSKLRKHFDDPLLVRRGRRLELTPVAESLLDPVGSALAAAELALDRSPTFDPATDERTFRIQASDYATATLLTHLVHDLADETPGVRLHVTDVSDDFEGQLRRGEVDVVIVPSQSVLVQPPCPVELLYSDRFVVLADRSNPIAAGVLDADTFKQVGQVVYRSGTTPAIAETQLDQIDFDHRVSVTCRGFVLAALLVQGSSLVCIIPERLARKVATNFGLVVLDAPIEFQPIHESMYWTPRNTHDAAHRWLRERLLLEAAKLRDS